MCDLNNKYDNLKDYLKNLKSAVVAYSSGVDSTFLLKTAHDILKDNVIAITLNSCLFSKKELNEAIEFCKSENIKHIIIDVDILNIEGFILNPPDRCYLCKKELFKKVIETAKKFGIENILEGSNTDDDNDYRPGMKAIQELNIKSPLKIARLNKKQIRELSKQFGLKTFNKPSMACLASRIPYGENITREKLKMIEEAESFLFEHGFKELRVRIQANNSARIEVLQDDFKKIIDARASIVKKVKSLGFRYISLDIEGFRSGSLNEIL